MTRIDGGQYRARFAAATSAVVLTATALVLPSTGVPASARTSPTDVGTVVPARLLDTRSNGETVDGEFLGAGKVQAGSFTKVEIAGRGNVPVDAVGVELNITAIQNEGRGFATLYPCTAAPPTASTLNYTPGVNIANATTVALDSSGDVCVYTSATAHYALDVVAFIPAGSDVGTVVPARLLDTRSNGETVDGEFLGAGKVQAGSFTKVEIAGRGNVPVDAVGVELNITAIQNEGRGFATLYPCTAAPPTASTLNYTPGVNIANATTVALDSSGDVCVYTSATAHYALDVVAYVTAPVTSPPPPLEPVSGVTAIGGSTMVQLSWTNPTDERFAGVVIRRSNGATPPGGPTEGQAVAETGANATSFVDRSLDSATTYSYALFAYATDGATAPAAAATVATNGVQPLARSLTVRAGTSVAVDLSAALSDVTSLVPASVAGISVSLTDGGQVAVAAAAGTAAGQVDVVTSGSGCVAQVCDVAFTLDLGVTTAPLVQMTRGVDSFTQPSPDRLAAAIDLGLGLGSQALNDEVVMTLGTPVAPGDLGSASAIAAQVGAIVSAGLEDLGVYELRWTTAPSDIRATVDTLTSLPGVADAGLSTFGGIGDNATPPGDWTDDGPAATWPFTQIRAREAWDITTGESTKIGIVDTGTVFGAHEDLNVVETLGGAGAAGHATHVAGLACAAANGKGLVGVAWGCPIVTTGLGAGNTWEQLYKNMLSSARDVALSGARVVNMSLGRNLDSPDVCVTQGQSDAINAEVQNNSAAPFRQLFNGPIGRDIVWTLAAGNSCGEGVHSPMGASWALPNVITVAASNSNDTLASFSNFGPGVEVAAPGGVGVGISGGEGGIWSTLLKRCGPFGLLRCSDYGQKLGTSMAAPMVAGLAGLARSANPSMSAADVGSCIVSTAGTGTATITARSTEPRTVGTPPEPVTPKIDFAGQIPIVDALAAVRCAESGPTRGDVVIAGQGDRTASGNFTDIGDLAAELSSQGLDVVTSASVPSDLSEFGQLWYIDTEAMTADEQDRVATYAEAGHGVYLTGEWGCCRVDNSTIALINRLVSGSTVSHGGRDGNVIGVGPGAPYGLGDTPNAVQTVTMATPGSLTGVPAANTVGTGSSSNAVIAAWGPDRVAGGGRIAVVMDINWIAEQYRADNWHLFVENLAHFLA